MKSELTTRYNEAIEFFNENLDSLDVITGRPSRYKGDKIPVSNFEIDIILANLTTNRTDKNIIIGIYDRIA